jgi:hypothetical protein
MRWHKAANKLRDYRVISLTPAARGVLMFLEELLAAEAVLVGSVSQIAGWVSADRKTTRLALEAIGASGYLQVTSEEKGKLGTIYTVRHPQVDPKDTPSCTQVDPKLTPTTPQVDPNHAPDKSRNDAPLQAAPLYRLEENREEENNTPLPPKGEASEVDLLPDPPKRKPKTEETPAWFEALWEANPRKVGKAEALKAAKRIAKVATPETIEHIAYAWSRFVADYQAKNGADYTYLKHLSSWLNAERWTDYERPSNLVTFRPKSDKPWADLLERHLNPMPNFRMPEYAAVENIASELGVDPQAAQSLLDRDGLDAAMAWIWDNKRAG